MLLDVAEGSDSLRYFNGRVWNVRQLIAVPGSDLVLPTAGLLRNRHCSQRGVKPDQGACSLPPLPHLPVWVLMCNDGAF